MSYISPENAFIPSFLKKRISSIENSNPSIELKNLFMKCSKEVLLKSYRCSMRVDDDHLIGKLYVSTNNLCFVCLPKKFLKVIIGLSDVINFEANDSGFFNIFAFNKAYTFSELNRQASALSFLSNYLRLGHSGTSKSISYLSKSTLNASSTLSSDNQSLSLSSQSQNYPSSNQNSASLGNKSLPSSSKGKVLESKIIDPVSNSSITCLNRDFSSFTVKSPSLSLPVERLHVVEDLKPLASHRFDKVSEHDSSPKRCPVVIQNVENYLFPALHSLSDVAFQASCIPLSLLCRLVGGAFSTSLHLPTRAALPSRSFTIIIAYIILAFLTISTGYIYYRIEMFYHSLLRLQAQRVDSFLAVKENCGSEQLHDVHSSLTHLLDLSSGILLSMNNFAITYNIDVNSSIFTNFS